MQVGIALMGGFAVTIDGAAVPAAAWRRRQAAALVKLLALAPRARLHRDRVIDALWPDSDLEAALPRLHKAAFFAREALGARDAVVVRAETVALFPGADLSVDVAAFDAAADAALHRDPSVEACAAALALHHGELLPDDLHEPWTDEPRLRLAARYEQLLHAYPGRGPTPHRPRIAETLVDRDAERAALRRVVRSVTRTGSGVVVAVVGEAGSGKSTLVRAFAADLDDDVVVATGSCDDLLAPRGLGPFRDMADALPDLAAALPGPADDVFPALLRALAVRPTVVVVEDVHWADDATLDAIRYLSRRITGVPAVLVLTYREEDVDAAHPLRGILGGLGGGTLERIAPAPLSVAAIRALGGVTQRQAVEIHRITRGNAFFVTEVLDAAGDGVPATVRDAVLARVGRLPAAARRLAERLAVVPSRAEHRLAEALAGDEPAALGRLERCGVLGSGAGHVAFRHELTRRAIESSLTPSERIAAHRAVLDVLLRQPPVEPARVVHHAVAALRADLLVEHGPVAAAAAQDTGAFRQAAATLHVVLQHADHLDDATRARLLTRRAYALYVVNDYDNGLACAESAVTLAAADPEVLADALMTLARITLFVRGPTQARQAADGAVRILERIGDDTRLAAGLIELARTHSNLPTLGVVAQPTPAGVRHAERAVALCERLGRADLLGQALCYLGSNRLAGGDVRGLDDLERALAGTPANPRLETRARIHVNAAGSAFRAGRRVEAQRYVAAGLREAGDSEFAAGRYRLHLTSAALAAGAGPWDDAVAELRQLIATPGRPGLMALLARSLLARLLARRGDPDARRVLDEALADPTAGVDSYVAGPLAVAELELAWLGGTDPGTPTVRAACGLAERSGHTAMLGELAGYLRRTGCAAQWMNLPTTEVPGPWAAALAGRWREAAAGWRTLRERYEEAVELTLSGDDDARAAGLAVLDELGARATVARVSQHGTAGPFRILRGSSTVRRKVPHTEGAGRHVQCHF